MNLGTGTAPGTSLFVINYTGTERNDCDGNTFFRGDGSPSDTLVVNLSATGNTQLRITNADGPSAETVVTDGIQVVRATRAGVTTDPNAFTRSWRSRAGFFDYRLFQGAPAPTQTPTTGSCVPTSLCRSCRSVPRRQAILRCLSCRSVPRCQAIRRCRSCRSVLSLPSTPPPDPLLPGVEYPIIGPELATYGVVQPLARQLGLSILGTLDDRRGDTYEPDGCAVAPAVASAAPETSTVDLPTRKPAAVPTKKPGPAPCPLFSPSAWGRFFGQTIHNHYSAFADPRADGNLGGFQGGIDLLRGSLIAGQYERAGLYGAYGDVNADVDGLVTNPAATAYINSRTGSMNLDAWSAGGYWTHTGPGGWYLDAVLQGTWYGGSASTQFARLNTDGTGFIASLEGGHPSHGRNSGRAS